MNRRNLVPHAHSAISFYLYLRPSASSRSSHGAVTLRCLTPPLQRWAAPPHLPTPVLLSSCSLDKAITPLCKQFIIIQKEATAFETNTFQITVDGLWFLIVGFCFFLIFEVRLKLKCFAHFLRAPCVYGGWDAVISGWKRGTAQEILMLTVHSW